MIKSCNMFSNKYLVKMRNDIRIVGSKSGKTYERRVTSGSKARNLDLNGELCHRACRITFRKQLLTPLRFSMPATIDSLSKSSSLIFLQVTPPKSHSEAFEFPLPLLLLELPPLPTSEWTSLASLMISILFDPYTQAYFLHTGVWCFTTRWRQKCCVDNWYWYLSSARASLWGSVFLRENRHMAQWLWNIDISKPLSSKAHLLASGCDFRLSLTAANSISLWVFVQQALNQ